MERFVKGDVIIINFPYSDLKHHKKRPALVIKSPKGDDVIACQITSIFSKENVNIILNDNDFEEGGLNRKSFIRLDKIFSIESSMIKYKAGSLKEDKISKIIKKICEYLNK